MSVDQVLHLGERSGKAGVWPICSEPCLNHPGAVESLLHLDPQHLAAQLGELIRRYVNQAQPELALSIVAHLEALYLRPDFALSPEESCGYRRALRHWRWLAMQCRPSLEIETQQLCPGG